MSCNFQSNPPGNLSTFSPPTYHRPHITECSFPTSAITNRCVHETTQVHYLTMLEVRSPHRCPGLEARVFRAARLCQEHSFPCFSRLPSPPGSCSSKASGAPALTAAGQGSPHCQPPRLHWAPPGWPPHAVVSNLNHVCKVSLPRTVTKSPLPASRRWGIFSFFPSFSFCLPFLESRGCYTA